MNQDRLTELNDRISFMTLIKRQCEQSFIMGSTLGVLVVDITCFRKINAVFGYKAGDAVLVHLARTLERVGRKRDLMARFGDNQFAMILPGLMNVGHAVLAAAKVLRHMEVPFTIDNHQIKVEVTVGIAVYPDHGKEGEVLLHNAEQALHQARASGAPYAVLNSEKRDESWVGMDIEFDLQSAVSGGELELFYQPKLDLRSNVPIGAEALMRWNSPARGHILPDEFILIAEQSGLIMDMTQWAINTALRESQEWPRRWDSFSVAVNLSARVLNDPILIDLLGGSLGIWEANADDLILEVTESSAMADPDSSFEVFRRIKELDAKISLDDFGTGFSSLAYFRNIPADELKLDKSFVKDMVHNPSDRHIAKLVIDLAHGFDLTVVAEGVEDAETYDLLAKLGCDYAQGYFIAKPMPQREYCAWLESYQELTDSGPRLGKPTAAGH